jgi:hypothetical protein
MQKKYQRDKGRRISNQKSYFSNVHPERDNNCLEHSAVSHQLSVKSLILKS